MQNNHDIKQFRRKQIVHLLDTITLRMIQDNAASGYDIIGNVYEEYRLLISSGTVYSALYKLERQGLISGEWQGRKRVYKITDDGKRKIGNIRNSTDPDVAPFKPFIFKGA